MATFGKALGTSGAFIAGGKEVVDLFVQSARTLIYSTALPPALAYTTIQALKIVCEEKWRREHLRKLIGRFVNGANQLSLPVINSPTAIQPLLLGSTVKTMDTSTRLLEKGFYVTAIRPPTVPKGTSRLRITLTAAHSEEQVDQLLDALSLLV
jgi:8-amino-7-oxononanoate synthase